MGIQEYSQAVRLLPERIAGEAMMLSEVIQKSAEEFRLRPGSVAAVTVGGTESPLHGKPVTQQELAILLERCTRASVHTAMEGLTAGYVTAPGGHRLGVCGIAGIRDGKPVFRRFTSAVLRIAGNISGCAEPVMEQLFSQAPTESRFPGTLILSPPGVGKTTLLRDMIRELSRRGFRIGVADERGELAGQSDSEAGFFTGMAVDVLTGIPKAMALEMLIRTMAPQIVVMDEVSETADVKALQKSANCGISLLAAVHAASVQELYTKKAMHLLIEEGAFTRSVLIVRQGTARAYRVETL